eukprot:7376921-Prymnesium_polylepis.7
MDHGRQPGGRNTEQLVHCNVHGCELRSSIQPSPPTPASVAMRMKRLPSLAWQYKIITRTADCWSLKATSEESTSRNVVTTLIPEAKALSVNALLPSFP